MRKLVLAAALGLASLGAAAAGPSLPLPDAPVLLVIPDAGAFDRALGGGFRAALTGELSESDPVGAALARTRVGGKLVAEWGKLSKDVSLDWTALMRLRPRALGLALLSAGDLEAVLAIETPLAELPLALPPGEAKTHRGVPYHLVARGAGDERTAARRIGLTWSRSHGFLLLATSERALLLSLDRALSGSGVAPDLPGLASLRLDLPALRKDLYFRREFLFAEGTDGPDGVLLAALRLEGDRLVEVREAALASAPAAPAHLASAGSASAGTPHPAGAWPTEGRDVAAAGWETDGARLFGALRRGLLEPVPRPPERPVADRRPIPDPSVTNDRYLVDVGKPIAIEGKGGEGELPRWADALSAPSKDGFGWEIAPSGARRLVLEAGPELETRLIALAEETETRRAGRVARASSELLVGTRLPALAWKRTGAWLWLAARAADLADVPEPRRAKDVARWGRLALPALAAEGRLWARAEGPFSPETTRPFSDRVLGLLGWAPRLGAIDVERRIDGKRLHETIRFSRAEGASR
jgi:hypothetical protein